MGPDGRAARAAGGHLSALTDDNDGAGIIHNGRKRIRKFFGKSRPNVPNLRGSARRPTTSSCRSTMPGGRRRRPAGRSCGVPDQPPAGTPMLEYVALKFGEPLEFEIVDECQQRGLTFAAAEGNAAPHHRVTTARKPPAPSPSRTSRSRTSSWATCRS